MPDSRRALPFILVAVVSLALAVGAAAKRPITFDDLIAFGRVSDPQISPDGKWVAFTVDRYDKAANTRSSAIWLASLASGENRQLTRTDKRDWRPRWAADGKSIAFLSNRSGSWQVWTIRLDGGEATQLTELPVDLSAHNWSPDGRWLLFLADVYPDCHDAAKPGAALECTAKRDEEKEKSKVKAVLYDRLMIRHWNVWLDGKRGHVFVMAADGTGDARDLTPGDSTIPPFLDGTDGYDVSPDSKELVFSRNVDKDEARSTNGDVWTLPLSGGEPKKITANPAWDGAPQYSPDGKFIAYLAMARAGFEADRTRLVLYERSTGKTRELTADFDNNVGDFVWAPDSQKIYFESSVNAASSFYQVAVSGGAATAVVKTGTNSSPSLSPDGKTFAFSRQFIHRPAEIYRSSVETGEAQQLSHINDAAVGELEMNPAESFTVTGAEGATVQSWLIKPPGFDPAKKYPVVVLIHGGPQGTFGDDFHYRWSGELFAAPGYVVVMPNPRGSPGWGQKFVDEITADWGGKVYTDLMNVTDHVEKLPYVDKSRMCAGGGSYGGYMANWILGHSTRFRCLVSHAGVYNLTSMYGATEELWFPEWEFRGTPWTNREMYDRWSPHNSVANFKTPTLVIHGQLDYRVPFEQGLELFTTLQRQGVESKLLYFPDEAHWILKPQNGELWYKTVHAWLAEYLK